MFSSTCVVRELGQDICLSVFLKELGHSRTPLNAHRPFQQQAHVFAPPVNFGSYNWPGTDVEDHNNTGKLGACLNGSLVLNSQAYWDTGLSLGLGRLPVNCMCRLPGQADRWAFLVCWAQVNPETEYTGHTGFLHLWRIQGPADCSDGSRDSHLPRSVPSLPQQRG